MQICTTTYYFAQILYVPCIGAMICSEHRQRASYQMMIYMGIMHLIGVFVSGFSTGFLAIVGGVFCSAPRPIYVVGAMGMGKWAIVPFAFLHLYTTDRELTRCVHNIRLLNYNHI